MLEYTLIRKNNKNLYLRIREGKVVVTAPKNVSKAYVDQFVCKHRSWIEKRLSTSNKPLQNLDTIYIFENLIQFVLMPLHQRIQRS